MIVGCFWGMREMTGIMNVDEGFDNEMNVVKG